MWCSMAIIPLAGMALRLDLTVRDVRTASAAEIEAGSVAQPTVTILQTASSHSPLLH